MINWKTSIGLSLFLIAIVELLNIKDNYHPEKMTDSLIFLVGAFVASVVVASFLMLNGLKGLGRSRH